MKKVTWLLLIVAAPLFLALSGNRLLLLETADPSRAAAERLLESAFNRLETDRNPVDYYSRFFRRIENTVFSSPDPLKAWGKTVPRLKRHFRGNIDLLFLDGSGSPVRELCDRPVNRTLARKFVESYGAFLREKTELSNTAQAFLKTFVSPMAPVDRDSHGFLHNGSIIANKEYVYFSRPRPQGMIMAFLRPFAPLREMALAEQLIRFNRSTTNARLCLARGGEKASRILVRLGRRGAIDRGFWKTLQESPDGRAWFGQHLIGRRSLFPALWVVGRTSVSPSDTVNPRGLITSLPLEIALCCGLVFLLGRLASAAAWTASVRSKLVLAFLYTVLVPLVIMGVTARSFLAGHRQVLEHETWNRCEKALRTIDELFGKNRKDLSETIQKLFFETSAPGDDFFRDFTGRFKRYHDRLGFDFCRVFDANGKSVFAFNDSVVPTFVGGSVKMFPKLAVAILNRYPAALGSGANSLLETASAKPSARIDPVLTAFGARLNPFLSSDLRIGPFEVYWHSMPLGNPRSGITHMAFFLWYRKKLEWNYLRAHLEARSRHDPVGSIHAWSHDLPGFSAPEGFRYRDLCRPIKARVTSSIDSAREILVQDGQNLLVTGLRGTHLKSFSLLSVTPDLEITRELGTLAGTFRLIVAAIVALCVLIGLFLTRLFLGPLGNLERGMAAMARNDFTARIPVAGKDELGRLALLFNDTMDDLKDLAIAGTVQESFFPRAPLTLGSWQVCGSCIPATHVGGDYFDFFPLDEHRTILFIGDVSGHGLGAALVVGMAKAIIGHPFASAQPLEILTALNTVLLSVLKRKKMMSACVGLFDHQSGTLSLANAGHVYPVLLAQGSPIFLELQGYPLGSTRNWKATTHTYPIPEGGLIVFYTDGLIEALDLKGKPIGYDRLLRALPDLIGETAVATEKAIRDWHRHFTREGPPEDDVSLMILQCGKRRVSG